LISYDLRNQRNYNPLYEQLNKWKAKRLLESVWLTELNTTSTSLRDDLKNLVDSDDGIAVIELKSDSMWATVRVKAEGLDWLKAKIP
jgi:CRISPR/Cas system-associated endoribonuclease Cas2